MFDITDKVEIDEARALAKAAHGPDDCPSGSYWSVFFNKSAAVRGEELRRFDGYIDDDPFLTDDEARIALCLYADMLEAGDWP